MKKKVFLVVSSLGAGGSEKVFWLLSQGFDKEKYDVYLILFDSTREFLSSKIPNVQVIDLKTIKASRSFFKLLRLIKKEKPYAVFSTAMHLNLLIAMISMFVKIPNIIARESNIFTERVKNAGATAKFWGLFVNYLYKRFDKIVCQSDEMLSSFLLRFDIDQDKLIVIPNPVLFPEKIKKTAYTDNVKRVLILARLVPVKSHKRLLEIFSTLPANYTLTIAGDGECRSAIESQVNNLGIKNRVNMLGLISNTSEVIAKHDVMALSSVTEGFPNAVLEALISGMPVVSFRVGGIEALIKNDFNGYIIEQDDMKGFRNSLIKACSREWDSEVIGNDAEQRFSLKVIADRYTSLLN
ncbi:MAG: hypothetical protein JWQ66_3396 [Mucilaginibacter sp.]|nr:hypothetical protein [Mucilaginibacter sp.]